ncbi:MFS transporter [Microbacterium sp. G2-8]|uniref:MFS transporter n=1 Tax=Microbacterium sp. G2-8 TaxID=2842454 RepID=UPI001C8902D2|nr:MFS transporter [Microbacterium sp. G2-8]
MRDAAEPTPPRSGSVWRVPGMRALIAMSSLGFAGYALLLPTAPLWARIGGADEAGAGLVNAVLMLATVLVQMTVPWALRTTGWRGTMIAGMLLLGAPSALFGLADDLWVILALSAVRGAGFAVLTVCGASAVAHLVEESHRGRAIGAYGLAIAVPQFLLTPISAWIAESVDFRIVFALGCLPVLAAPVAALLGARLDRGADAGDEDGEGAGSVGRGRLLLALAAPSLVLLAITTPGGAIISFAPQFGYAAPTVVAGLFAFTGAAAFTRWLAGGLADQFGPHRFIAPLLAMGAAGLAVTAWAVLTPDGRVAALLVGMGLVGAAYGALQNLTLVVSFASVPNRLRNVASTTWNIGFDAGTGLGALVVGFIAAGTSFAVGLSTTAAFCLLVAVTYVIQLMRMRRRALKTPPAF